MTTVGPGSAVPATWLIAWRDLIGDWRRSLLVLVLIMVPMAVLMSVLIVTTSLRPTPREHAEVTLGQAAGALVPTGCAPQIGVLEVGCGPDMSEVTPATLDQIVAAAPEGQHVVVEHQGRTVVEVDSVPIQVRGVVTDAADPLMRGRYDLREGTWPTGDEVLVNPVLADRGATVGGTVRIGGADYRVSGIVHAYQGHWASAVRRPVLVLRPHHPAATFDTDLFGTGTMVHLAGGVPDRTEYPQWNAQGIGVLDRSRMLAMPHPDRAGVDLIGNNSTLVIVGGALLLVMSVLVAGAALAVGARRKERTLALLSATGASPRALRTIFLVEGLVVGAGAAVAALGTGVAASAGVLALVPVLGWGWVFGLHLPWPWLLGGLLVSMLAGALAALVPGMRVAHADPARALRERHRAARPVVALVGLALAGLAVAMTASTALWVDRLRETHDLDRGALLQAAVLLGVAALLAVAGVLLGIPLILRWVSAVPSWLPLGWRLAARDLGRARHRTVPVTAAIVAAAMVAGATLVFTTYIVDRQQANHFWTARPGEVLVDLQPRPDRPALPTEVSTRDAGAVVAAVDAIVPVTAHRVMSTPRNLIAEDSYVDIRHPDENECPPAEQGNPSSTDWRCRPTPQPTMHAYPSIVIGDASLVEPLAGATPTTAMQHHLDSGGVITFHRQYVDAGGRVTLESRTAPECTDGECGRPTRTVLGSGPALVVPPEGLWAPTVLVSEATARSWGLVTEDRPPQAVVWMDLARTPSAAEADRIRAAAVSGAGGQLYMPVMVERGPEDLTAVPWLVSGASAALLLVVVGITTALAMTERRRDEEVLGVLGAAPRIRRGMAGAQAACLAVVGAVLGTGLGAYLSAATIRTLEGGLPRLTLPLIGLVVGVPLLAWGVGWLLSPGRAGLQGSGAWRLQARQAG